MTISPPKNLDHFKVTIKLLEDKKNDLIKRKSEEGSSESGGSRDLEEQAKMIKEIIENQKKKEALEQVKVQQDQQREDNLEENKQNEKIEVFEFLLREDKLKKMLEFCKVNKIEIFAKRIFPKNSPIEEKIAEILHKGPGAPHFNSPNHQHQR